jgi:pimeloyl-ACP methyl ester carboxylesterase
MVVRKWLRRTALALGALVLVAFVAGSSWEWLARRAARRDFPPPGRLVDVGARRIQIDCRGQGTPVVVLEAGLGDGTLAWSAVHDSLARSTRTCAYSRAGILWSDRAPGPNTPQRVAEDLRAALAGVGASPPFVLVGHSIGGPYVMTYAKYFGADVAGVVLVDASHPDQVQRLAAIAPVFAAAPSRLERAVVALAWTGVARLLMGGGSPLPNQGAAVARAVAAYAPLSVAGGLKEIDALSATLAEAGTFRHLGDRPLFVLTAMKPFTAEELTQIGVTAAQGAEVQRAWKAMQDDEATWSIRSQHRLVDDASHYIQYWRPDVVIAAVRSVLDSVRSKTGS